MVRLLAEFFKLRRHLIPFSVRRTSFLDALPDWT